jgi:hypothetical protein
MQTFEHVRSEGSAPLLFLFYYGGALLLFLFYYGVLDSVLFWRCWVLFYSGGAGFCSMMAGLGMCKSVLVKKAVQKKRWVVQKMAVEGWKKVLAKKWFEKETKLL